MTGEVPVLPEGCCIVLNPQPGISAVLLTDAFAKEPGMRWLCGANQRRRQTWFAATERLLARRPGTTRYLLLRDGRPVAAQWVTTPAGQAPLAAQLGWLFSVLIGCGPATVARTAAYRRKEEKFIPPRATILEFLGVSKEVRGTGLGGVLLRWALADALTGSSPAPVHLSTADPRNVELYRHLSFGVDGRFTLSGIETTAMSLTRNPSEDHVA